MALNFLLSATCVTLYISDGIIGFFPFCYNRKCLLKPSLLGIHPCSPTSVSDWEQTVLQTCACPGFVSARRKYIIVMVTFVKQQTRVLFWVLLRKWSALYPAVHLEQPNDSRVLLKPWQINSRQQHCGNLNHFMDEQVSLVFTNDSLKSKPATSPSPLLSLSAALHSRSTAPCM